MMGTFHEFIISHCILLGKRNISDKCYGQNQNTHFMPIHVAGNHAIYGAITRNFIEQEPRDMIIYYRCIVV